MNTDQAPNATDRGSALKEGLDPGAYRHFEGMTWPVPGERLDELESALRFAERGAVFSISERLVIASFLSAYRELVALPARVRDARVRELRKGPRTSYGTTPRPNSQANQPTHGPQKTR
jgi:hypothetical protein